MARKGEAITPEAQLTAFLAKFTPEIAARAEAILMRLRKQLPNAIELVYDNYNALAIGFGPSEKSSQAIFSVAVFPRWVSLFFLQGKGLPDPAGILKGGGNKVRHVVIKHESEFDDPAIQALVGQALANAVVALDLSVSHRLVIKSISAKQRPRRPASSPG
jgi:hypothetical protein